MRQLIARYVSTIGHPLITIPVFILFVMFTTEEFSKALFVSLLIIGGVFIPMTGWILIRKHQGKYSNFDVSVRTERKSLFVFVIPFLILVTSVLFLTNQPLNLSMSVLFALILTVVSQLVNFQIKSSLHVALTIYLAALILTLNLIAGVVMFFLSFLIGWSRVELGRHTKNEVVAGFVIGILVSAGMLFAQGFISL